jgi:acyl-CoA thioester hydrolase
MRDATEVTRAEFPRFVEVPTRWADNDIYGHVNNAHYYALFDTAINRYLIADGGLDIANGRVIAVVAESRCRFMRSLAFPETAEVGLRVGALGRSSVPYELAVFKQGEATAAAVGFFVHVFVDRETRRPTPIPAPVRAALERLLVSEHGGGT